MDKPKSKDKPFEISKREVWEAYQKVKANQGAAGVDGVSIEEFEKDLQNNLYRIWNRMSSGSYFPPAVKAVPIPKDGGRGARILGVPTVGDRIAQTVVAARLEPRVEKIFHTDSDGYRVGRSAIDAVAKCRQRCWRYDWVIDLDIQKFFDSCPHDLIVKAVEVNADAPWVLLYVKRWLTAPMRQPDGTLAFEPDGRELPGHPRVEGVVEEQIGQNGRNRRPLRGALVSLLICTSVGADKLDPAGVVTAYKNLSHVERDWRNIKVDDLDLRPIHHRLADRVKAHVLICMLAEYLTWHLRRALAPLTYTDEQPPERSNPVAPAQRSTAAARKASRQRDEHDQAYHNFRGLLTHMATLTRNDLRYGNKTTDPTIPTLATPTRAQRRAFDLIGATIPVTLA